MSKQKNPVVVCCYNQIENWEKRTNAIDFYLDAMANTEGSESERYKHIYLDLLDRKEVCTDGVSHYSLCLANNWYAQFDNPNNTRDYEDEIYYPKN